MRVNMGPTEQKIRMGIGAGAAAAGIFAPLRMKWKAVLTAAAFEGLFTGATGHDPFKRALGVGRR